MSVVVALAKPSLPAATLAPADDDFTDWIFDGPAEITETNGHANASEGHEGSLALHAIWHR